MKSWWVLALGILVGIGIGDLAFRKAAVAPTVNPSIRTDNTNSASSTNDNATVVVNSNTNSEVPVNTNAAGGADQAVADRITVDAPVANARVTSPLTVSGQAQGSWFFEATFRVTLVDSNGAELASGNARAQGDSMTSDFVPFTARLEFVDLPSTATGTLVLSAANPSGLPANAAELRIPVRFQ